MSHAARMVASAISLTLVFAAGCSERQPASGVDDGWVLEGDVAGPDAGGNDIGVPDDTGSPDSSVDCRRIDGRAACRDESACQWWDDPCSEDPSDGGCLPEGTTPARPKCPPDKPCSEYGSEKACTGGEDCNWVSKTCPDGSTVGKCLGPAAADPVLECPDDEPSCAERAPERCPEGECSIESPGCGSNPDAFDGPTCLPEGTCEGDADCKEGLTCLKVTLEPSCTDMGCGACGSWRPKCVPDSWAEQEASCRDFGPERCGETERCRMLWPACNDEAPSGAKTFEEPTCLSNENCGNDGGCSEGYHCETVWEGCPPNADCLRCASKANRCLRDN